MSKLQWPLNSFLLIGITKDLPDESIQGAETGSNYSPLLLRKWLVHFRKNMYIVYAYTHTHKQLAHTHIQAQQTQVLYALPDGWCWKRVITHAAVFLFPNMQQAESSDHHSMHVLAPSHILHHRGRGTDLLSTCWFWLSAQITHNSYSSVMLNVKALVRGKRMWKPHFCVKLMSETAVELLWWSTATLTALKQHFYLCAACIISLCSYI